MLFKYSLILFLYMKIVLKSGFVKFFKEPIALNSEQYVGVLESCGDDPLLPIYMGLPSNFVILLGLFLG